MDQKSSVTPQLREQIYDQLLEVMISSLERGEWTEDDAAQSADLILSTLDTIATRDELLEFLLKLSSRWEAFSSVYHDVKKEELLSKVNQELHQLTH